MKIINSIKLVILALCYAVALNSCVGTNAEGFKTGLQLGVSRDGYPQISKDNYSIILPPDGSKIIEWTQPQVDGTEIIARATFGRDGRKKLSYFQNGVEIAYDDSAKSSITITVPETN